MSLNLQTLTSPTTSSDVIADIENPADSSDLVVTLKNLATESGKTTNATQTVSAAQGTALQGKGLYLPGTTSNYASVPDADNLEGFNDFTFQIGGVRANGTSQTVLGKWGGGTTRSYVLNITAAGTLLLFWQGSSTGGNVASSASLDLLSTATVRVIRLGSDIYFYVDYGSGYIQLGNTQAFNDLQLSYGTGPLYIGMENSGSSTNITNGIISEVKIWNTATPDTSNPVLNIDFTSNNITTGATSFTADSGQVVTINQSGDDVARIVKGSHLIMDIVDDEYEFTTDSAINGTIVVATTEGTYSANISLDASTQYDLQARGVAASANYGFLKNPVGYLISSSPLSDSEITQMENYFVSKGAAPRSAFGSVTIFSSAWYLCSSLTSFPLINTSSGTRFDNAWYNCSLLTSFPLIDTSSATNVLGAWRSCSSLASFPLIATSSVTNFINSWRSCSSLTSFPAINTSLGTSFDSTWRDCSSLTSFPLLDTSSGTIFSSAWYGCDSLTAFPLIDTSSGTLFSSTWRDCDSLTSFPLLNTSSGQGFAYAWRNCTSLTSFPLIDTSSALSLMTTWYGCNSLTSFPLINTSSVKNLQNAWRYCTSLTSFPLIDTSSVTSFQATWFGCDSLTSFPLINTSSGTRFEQTWRNCWTLTSFPLIDTSSGTRFDFAWNNCNSLTTFPSGFFDNWSPASVTTGVFNFSWGSCTSLTPQSVENILTSLDTSGVHGTDTGASGGTQLADHTIDIDYDGGTLSSATTTAITNLKAKNWAISINSVIQ